MNAFRFEVSFRQSKIGNPKSKMGGAFHNRCRRVQVCGARAEAQQPTKVPRIGYLTAVSLSAFAARTEAFRQGLRELGYMEGKNILIEYRYAEGKSDRCPRLRTN